MTAAQWAAAAAVALWAQATAVDFSLYPADRPSWFPWLVLAAVAVTALSVGLLVGGLR